MVVSLLFQTIPIGLYVFLTQQFGPKSPDDGETRCRKCQYILKGITEPICPECGEKI
jgi:rubrerythrin